MYRRGVRPNPNELDDWFGPIEEGFRTLPVVPFPIAGVKAAFKKAHAHPLAWRRIEQLPIFDTEDIADRVSVIENGFYFLAFEQLPEVMFQWVKSFLRRIVIGSEDLWQAATGSFIRGGGHSGGAHIFDPYTGKSTIMLHTAEVQKSLPGRGGGIPPFWVLCHEVGHAFQFLSTAEDRRILHTEALKAGFAEPTSSGSVYKEEIEHHYGAWVEAFADVFGFFYTNQPVGIKGAEMRPLDLIIRRLHNAAKSSRKLTSGCRSFS